MLAHGSDAKPYVENERLASSLRVVSRERRIARECQPDLYPNQTSGNDRQGVRLEWYFAFIDIPGRGSQSSL